MSSNRFYQKRSSIQSIQFYGAALLSVLLIAGCQTTSGESTSTASNVSAQPDFLKSHKIPIKNARSGSSRTHIPVPQLEVLSPDVTADELGTVYRWQKGQDIVRYAAPPIPVNKIRKWQKRSVLHDVSMTGDTVNDAFRSITGKPDPIKGSKSDIRSGYFTQATATDGEAAFLDGKTIEDIADRIRKRSDYDSSAVYYILDKIVTGKGVVYGMRQGLAKRLRANTAFAEAVQEFQNVQLIRNNMYIFFKGYNDRRTVSVDFQVLGNDHGTGVRRPLGFQAPVPARKTFAAKTTLQ